MDNEIIDSDGIDWWWCLLFWILLNKKREQKEGKEK